MRRWQAHGRFRVQQLRLDGARCSIATGRGRRPHGWRDDCVRLDAKAQSRGWTLLGGTSLFRLYETGDALAAQDKLARGQIWSRVFQQKPGWLRLGLPGSEAEWSRLAAVLSR
ncbi:hypothetical protein ACVWY2_009760 [Bradyrhizobium sp. JR6.1]